MPDICGIPIGRPLVRKLYKHYTLVNSLTGRVSSSPMPEDESMISLPDTFAEFLLSQI